ncbi:YqaA family protein [Neomoorella thermoacetica]|uniref:YqaA family protein n=1 Tax=Neomoorella thermoacetica TaxID=1525 RepID=UPI0008FA9F73|nr:YqaA family protein [Moorella thermoacetica]OIQ11064.1 SNARE associated golgi protein [Moorella thermoacetica]
MLVQLTTLLEDYGVWGLIAVAFAEASFFPIPPDALLIPMAIIDSRQALFYALVTTLFSTIGGVFGYWIGLKAGRPLLDRMASGENIRKVESLFQTYGGWAIFLAALTPIPYKVFTIAAGVFHIAYRPLVVASLIGRGLRFFAEALFIILFGPMAQALLAKYFGPLTALVGLAVVLWLVLRQRKGGL